MEIESMHCTGDSAINKDDWGEGGIYNSQLNLQFWLIVISVNIGDWPNPNSFIIWKLQYVGIISK